MTDDLLSNHARALALRGKLIAAGFDPLTVAYNAATREYVVEMAHLNTPDVFPLARAIEPQGYKMVQFEINRSGATFKFKEAK